MWNEMTCYTLRNAFELLLFLVQNKFKLISVNVVLCTIMGEMATNDIIVLPLERALINSSVLSITNRWENFYIS